MCHFQKIAKSVKSLHPIPSSPSAALKGGLGGGGVVGGHQWVQCKIRSVMRLNTRIVRHPLPPPPPPCYATPLFTNCPAPASSCPLPHMIYSITLCPSSPPGYPYNYCSSSPHSVPILLSAQLNLILWTIFSNSLRIPFTTNQDPALHFNSPSRSITAL